MSDQWRDAPYMWTWRDDGSQHPSTAEFSGSMWDMHAADYRKGDTLTITGRGHIDGAWIVTDVDEDGTLHLERAGG